MYWWHNHNGYSLRLNGLQNTNKQQQQKKKGMDQGTLVLHAKNGIIARRKKEIKKEDGVERSSHSKGSEN